MQRVFLLIIIAILSLSACVQPPDISDAQVLQDQELKLVSLLKRGTDYVAAGRMDLAEVEFRKAIRLSPNLASAYNDLGIVLQAQTRYDEAAVVLHKAVDLAPNNIVARDNLARTLYLKGDAEAAAKEFESLLLAYAELSPSEVQRLTGQSYSAQDIGRIYRSLSAAYLRNGDFDEAICNSSKAVAVSGALSQSALHARLLLSLGYLDRATDYLRSTLSVYQDQTTPELLLDYGIALFSKGDFDTARDSFLRLIANPKINGGQRRSALLFRIILARKAKNDSEASDLKSTLFTDDPGFCKSEVVDPDGYWPRPTETEVKDLISSLCADDE